MTVHVYDQVKNDGNICYSSYHTPAEYNLIFFVIYHWVFNSTRHYFSFLFSPYDLQCEIENAC